MTSRSQILSLLRGAEASRIRFTFPSGGGTTTISARTFHRVANAIDANTIRVQPTNAMPANHGAEYHSAADPGGTPPIPHRNTILTPPVIGRSSLGLALHECVHAAYDIQRSAVSALDDEASAYVVMTLYYRMTGLAHPRWGTSIRDTAVRVANNLLQQYQRGTTAIPTVDSDSWNVLRLVVMTSPVYMFPDASQPWRLGVVPTGGSYTHDG